MAVDIIGWTVAILGILMPVPQFVRLVQEKTSAGLSAVAWQIWLSAGIAWSFHGVLKRDPIVFLPNFLGGIIALSIVLLIRRDRKLSWWLAVRVTVAVVTCAVAIRLGIGPAGFGTFMACVQTVGCVGQLVDVIESPDITGVSPGYLALTTFCQGLWIAFGIMKPDVSVVISGCVMLAMSGVTLIWYLLRRHARLRPIRLRKSGIAVSRVD